MDYRNLGKAGVKVSPVCLGTMMFGGQTDEAESIRIIRIYRYSRRDWKVFWLAMTTRIPVTSR